MITEKLLTDDEKDKLRQVDEVLREVVPWLQKAVGQGMPYNDHLEKATEQLMWNDRFNDLFSVQPK